MSEIQERLFGMSTTVKALVDGICDQVERWLVSP
jgi:hypothetical protein